ncbi:glycosyltransferase [Mucilaginibacter myungsuensis]|uniref:Glycosyltransferase n=1 Tax=Mucilaginibacter myungsuensis TaxID=649104 RepID=A0A929KUZ4_9SPHI|nr:glycosyltransferase [Mucilaginibacter myungsuensis]MBE9662064.1 glycosyltransferase [Mucilaginibacter myungsuensis]MDN3599503.1 glycosyltransferase [Mucilaginibacter myungsuensis]
MVEVLNILWIAFQVMLGYNLVFPLLLYILYKLSGKPKIATAQGGDEPNDYAIIVTAYEQTYSLKAVVDSIQKLKYDNYLVYIVADKCDVTDLKFDDERVIVLRPEETLASNTRSHFYAINRFVRPHNILTIIDSDNLVHPDYLDELNRYFDAGYTAVQGVRDAKNLDTTYACLDAARDIYYHFYDGKVLFAVGSSATLAGSGMAFTTSLYRQSLEHLDVTGAGFDKVLQAQILQRNLRIAFAEDAIVYDEKTTRSDQLVNQRARWINTWFKYFKLGFTIIGSGIKNFSRNQIIFGLVLLRPPLFIFLILSVFCMFINLWVSLTAVIVWALGFTAFVLGFVIALRSSHTDPRVYRSLKNIPVFMYYQLISLYNSRRANKRSVATQHYHEKSINDIIDKE